MANVLINGISAKSGGGRSILTNFLTVLKDQNSGHKFTVVVPSVDGYNQFICEYIDIVPFRILSKQAILPFASALVLPRLATRLKCDVIFNLADLPIPTNIPQLFLFDWPYAAYPESTAWKLGGFVEVNKRKFKYLLFRRYLKFVNSMIAQGPAMRDKLKRLYKIENISIVPNAVSTHNLDSFNSRDFALGDGFKLLCLSQYYSHKNLEIFINLAELIKLNQLNWKIIITIHGEQGVGARELLENIKRRSLENIIVNIGTVSMHDVPSLYRQCDALLLPTLLESFSGTYVEAMYHGKPIFTSNYDFAVDVCQNSAFYFDPVNAQEIFECINIAVNNEHLIDKKVSLGKERLSMMLNWNQAFDSYIALINKLLEKDYE